jgi:hypothetical protein
MLLTNSLLSSSEKSDLLKRSLSFTFSPLPPLYSRTENGKRGAGNRKKETGKNICFRIEL